MAKKQRADILLVERGYFESRARARAAIEAGLVTADGEIVPKPSVALREDTILEACAAHPYVSRGGVKLAAALDAFGFDPAGRACLDIGASTGGFSHVLLSRGARRVVAVDVGRKQLHAMLKGEPRLVSLESQDIRTFEAARLEEKPSFIVVDVSFISLTHVLPAATRLAAPRAFLVGLVKPQFEAARAQIKKGIVRDPAVHQKACARIVEALGALEWTVLGTITSPIRGGDGNLEFLVGARRG
ncbi:MAG: TlyA family RNA methyltransferase [Hyphomicrobiales bacterium]|nr:TlyA family RNA methyltransferase [Hyphomicrobiales bacterium]MBV9050757.1 TlyA family RNA methyltransferase [Hyphomicrobiales bacterium]MBV9136371.1 TlyA family RNA methyltransferase [Hyphomicrobiales bacterium]MBV9592035.1 TlyA family RNA methyltransferase [Hyphomicrobiales bacterium]MBV9978087.1 TlyA family RNA methyltransferase [Hyphomicrobiales bacterium]